MTQAELDRYFWRGGAGWTKGDVWEYLIVCALSPQVRFGVALRNAKALVDRYPGPRELAAARAEEVGGLVKGCRWPRKYRVGLVELGRWLGRGRRWELVDRMHRDVLARAPLFGKKTASMFVAYRNPTEESPIPVDLHVVRWANAVGAGPYRDKVTSKQYEVVEEVVRGTARRLGRHPLVLAYEIWCLGQAGTAETVGYRRAKRIQVEKETE